MHGLSLVVLFTFIIRLTRSSNRFPIAVNAFDLVKNRRLVRYIDGKSSFPAFDVPGYMWIVTSRDTLTLTNLSARPHPLLPNLR
jgi:hypothetical protein